MPYLPASPAFQEIKDYREKDRHGDREPPEGSPCSRDRMMMRRSHPVSGLQQSHRVPFMHRCRQMAQKSMPSLRKCVMLFWSTGISDFNEINPELVMCSYVPEPGVEPGVPKRSFYRALSDPSLTPGGVSDDMLTPDNIGALFPP
jgi:hypothetical protein